METSGIQTVKLALMGLTGLSRDSLHIHFGLLAMLLVALLLRKSLASPLPWLAALAAAVFVELWDMRDDIAGFGRWRWDASLHDVVNTIFWPTLLLLAARAGTIGFRRPLRRDEVTQDSS